MGWAGFNAEEVPNEVILYMLDLIDRINYTYLKTDGTYGNLAYVVSDKVKLIEKALWKRKEELSANTFEITERKCEMCKGYGPGAATKMVLDKTGETIAKFHLCGGCIEEMRETYKDVINKSTVEKTKDKT